MNALQDAWKKFWGLRWRWKAPIIGVLVLLILGSLDGADTSEPGSESTALPTAVAQQATDPSTPVPIVEPTTAAVTPTPTEAPSTIIRGLTAVDVTRNLENRGFDCTGMQRVQDIASWSCQRTSFDGQEAYLVEVMGRGPQRIQLVDATVFQYGAQASDAVAAEFLSFVATVPYEDADPIRARDWVRANIGSTEEITIGSARFQLLRAETGRAHVLEIVAVGFE